MMDIVGRLRRAGTQRSVYWRLPKSEVLDAADEIERLRTLIDPTLTFRDLETKVRDGVINARIVWGEGNEVAMRWLAATMWHAILGDDNEEPENYRMGEFEFSVKPRGDFRPIRAAIEVIKPGGKSSHEIRRDLEAELAQLRVERATQGNDCDV